MGQSGRRREFQLPGFCLSPREDAARGMGRPVYADSEGAHSAAVETQGRVSTLSLTASGPPDCLDQSDATRMGQLFSGGPCQSVLWLCEGLGGEEGAATGDAGTPASGFRLEKVEEVLALRATRTL